MYHGSNPTALQSQRMITEALFTLLKEKELSKINIKELCAKAMISRQTFYSLFGSKEEVVGLYFDILFQNYVERFIKGKKIFTTKDFCSSTITYLLEQKELLELVIKNNLDYVVKEKMEGYLSELGDMFHIPMREDHDYVIAFLSGALMNVISLMVKKKDFEDGARISALIERIITGEYFGI